MTSGTSPILPPHITVFERGWLSANNILFAGPGPATLVDSGYHTHAAQTVALVESALDGRPLERLLNTHLHSDHCGGNALLQQRWPQLQTLIPPGQFAQVRDWDPVALSYVPTGQQCAPFRADGTLEPGQELELGGRIWQVHAAPGHDPHAVLLFEPEERVLISGDALWEHGFGVVFPEIEGEGAFDEVAATLDAIERLAPLVVIPGHGSVFGDVPEALARARKRLAGFVAAPLKHARYAAKVLLKYKLLEWQHVALADALAWLHATPYFSALHARYFAELPADEWARTLVEELVAGGAARREGDLLVNT
ncbi:MBL fold metallo-hydrolase [Melaminivora alkalimesophila]|uniref:Glyoxylase-like metal-dependent hydrolase (Beta-lactamase superfamily II) n=1 Tax=Melaminivora alkalimesophila TaxID=1165852 RepID=A0A317R9M9_9BURK|nr:MBL fold metallo-hydrolase [Melaminivora alkalimesophila]PWW45685.1 glyoxylase-like metal-dependent hydrolase (beta-lactamase superfamily II) [Melaminivora alkalimesophila]